MRQERVGDIRTFEDLQKIRLIYQNLRFLIIGQTGLPSLRVFNPPDETLSGYIIILLACYGTEINKLGNYRRQRITKYIRETLYKC